MTEFHVEDPDLTNIIRTSKLCNCNFTDSQGKRIRMEKKEYFHIEIRKQREHLRCRCSLRPGSLIGSFSSKTRTSWKTQLLFHVLEHSSFPAISLPQSSLQTDKFPKNSLHSRISIICKCSPISLCFPHDVLFLQSGLQKYTFQVVSFRIERTLSLLRLSKVLKLISLCNLHPRTKYLLWRLLDSHLLAKTA